MHGALTEHGLLEEAYFSFLARFLLYSFDTPPVFLSINFKACMIIVSYRQSSIITTFAVIVPRFWVISKRYKVL